MFILQRQCCEIKSWGIFPEWIYLFLLYPYLKQILSCNTLYHYLIQIFSILYAYLFLVTTLLNKFLGDIDLFRYSALRRSRERGEAATVAPLVTIIVNYPGSFGKFFEKILALFFFSNFDQPSLNLVGEQSNKALGLFCPTVNDPVSVQKKVSVLLVWILKS